MTRTVTPPNAHDAGLPTSEHIGTGNSPLPYRVREAQPPASGCDGVTQRQCRASQRSRTRTARQYLTLEQVEKNWAALGFANQLNLRPNLTLDIHFDKGGLIDPHNRALPCLMAFLKSARQWIERKGYKTAYIWTFENRGDGEGHGIHAHVLIHVAEPLRTRFHQLKQRWARKAGLNASIAEVINTARLPTIRATAGKLKYMSKDLNPSDFTIFSVCDKVHLDDRGKASDQPIYFKKTGVSRNIDCKAQNEYRKQRQADSLARGLAVAIAAMPNKIPDGNSSFELAA